MITDIWPAILYILILVHRHEAGNKIRHMLNVALNGTSHQANAGSHPLVAMHEVLAGYITQDASKTWLHDNLQPAILNQRISFSL